MYLVDDEEGFDQLIEDLRVMFLRTAKPVDVGEWHSQPIDNPLLVTRELQDTIITFQVPSNQQMLERQIGQSTPWAEDHFQERISGRPMNPPPSNEWWPFAEAGNAQHKAAGIFSHTYPERFWPKYAGELGRIYTSDDEEWADYLANLAKHNRGIRFHYGDLGDVVQQLKDNPETRQAFLPVWFPEDTGVLDGQRVPCTLGYHFMIREGKLSCRYYIRSCDYMRHFKDDLYMAARLMQWISDQVAGTRPGQLIMYISSFHIFEGDVPKLKGS